MKSSNIISIPPHYKGTSFDEMTQALIVSAEKMNIPIAHIEAGLRSYNKSMPEETNRILVDRMADILFCPTQQAENNLQKEGFKLFDCKLFNYGDVMKDANPPAVAAQTTVQWNGIFST